ncbi:MAG: TIGR00266 family protein [Anaerolineae bacterium]|nr:TIGR00266 family protein [Anaerolineae bacterium]
MEYTIRGDVMPVLQIRLRKGEAIYTESGGMAWMTEGIAMKTSGRGGLGKMIGRALSGESLFLTTYTAEADNVAIAFAPEAMGKIIPLNLAAGNTMILQKDAFMCAEDSVEMAMHFRKKLGAGLFGGEGFILQKVTGPGVVFAEIIGEVVEYDLKPGQRLKVDPGHLAMYEPSVNYDIQMVKGVKNILFGGEGLFLATLTGPGKVWLQTMPISNLASRIAQAIPGKGGGSKSAGGLLGDIAGGFLDNI